MSQEVFDSQNKLEMKKCSICGENVRKPTSKYCKPCHDAIIEEYRFIVKNAWNVSYNRRIAKMAESHQLTTDSNADLLEIAKRIFDGVHKGKVVLESTKDLVCLHKAICKTEPDFDSNFFNKE